MYKITIQPHDHIVAMLNDRGSDAYDTWLGCELPWRVAARLRRYQELGTARIREAITDAEVEWTSEQIDASGVKEVEMTPEDEAVRRQVEHILEQALQEVRQWEPEWRCRCGEILGEYCYWTGPRSKMVVVAWMPEYLRGSYEAAGRTWDYPYRIRVSRECAEAILETEGDWAYVVEEATA